MSAERLIESFWNSHPCGENLVAVDHCAYEEFFTRYDAFRYSLEKHIPFCLNDVGFHGKDTLEIGLGQGADSEQIIRRGGCWSGLDLTQESVDRVRTRLALRKLPFHTLKKGSVLNIPFPDASFDIVYSHGVLHHVPDIHRAQSEIRRVLRRDGKLVVMLYAKRSLNYLLSISILRRLGLAAMHVFGIDAGGVYAEHLEQARKMGVRKYLAMRSFIHRNTDGPQNPYSKVYDLTGVAHDFPDFQIVRSHKEFMHAPPLPVHRVPGARWLGWHLWVHMVPR